MLNEGGLYLAYSGEVPRDSHKALMLKRTWESLRRNGEFQQDCHSLSLSSSGSLKKSRQRFTLKWGVVLTDPTLSFNEIVGNSHAVRLDHPKTFYDMYRRLYGDSFFGEDRVVRCEQFAALYRLLGLEDFMRISAIAQGLITPEAPLETLQDGSSIPQRIQLSIDVDQNPIAILYKVQLIIRALREARALAGKAPHLAARTKQQQASIAEQLDSDLVGDGRRDFGKDDTTFRVWDLSREGKTSDEIARTVWPDEYDASEGVRDAAGDRTTIGQRVYECKKRANEWIELYGKLIKDANVVFPVR